jgi:hypothetical protein
MYTKTFPIPPQKAKELKLAFRAIDLQTKLLADTISQLAERNAIEEQGLWEAVRATFGGPDCEGAGVTLQVDHVNNTVIVKSYDREAVENYMPEVPLDSEK